MGHDAAHGERVLQPPFFDPEADDAVNYGAIGHEISHGFDDQGGDQRLFLGWSQAWRCKYCHAELAKRLLNDPHSPAQFRANGAVTNLDAFYVKPGDGLYRAESERIRIW